jgi:Rrf2 family nitric oxide-sensitive transcriptional repressor
MLSQTVEYALRAALHIAREHPLWMRVTDVAEAIDAPKGYLAKILGDLARAGVLESSRGATGGFRLGSAPERLTLSDVVAAIEGAQERQCLLGHGKCGDNPGCTAHARWAPVAGQMDDFFGKTTLADLLHSPMPH